MNYIIVPVRWGDTSPYDSPTWFEVRNNLGTCLFQSRVRGDAVDFKTNMEKSL